MIDGGGNEYRWTYSIDPTVVGLISTPVRKYGDPTTGNPGYYGQGPGYLGDLDMGHTTIGPYVKLDINSDSSNVYMYAQGNFLFGSNLAKVLSFVTDNTQWLSIDSTGNIIMGSTSNKKFYLSSDASNFYAYSNSNLLIGSNTSAEIQLVTNNAVRARITAAGDIISSVLAASTSHVDDAAAALAGVAVGQLYRNGSVVQIRVT
jgi:hypothetical protein